MPFTAPLPNFDDPPVIEVALSVQFQPLESFRVSQYGLVWQAFRDQGLTRVEEHGLLAPTFEDFDIKRTPRVQFAVHAYDDAPPLPRVWLINEAGNELVQIQPDRLIVNWRKGVDNETYPRYVSILKRFRSAFATFERVVTSESLGAIIPTQCEITYVNHIVADRNWHSHADLDKVVTVWTGAYSDDFLGAPEDAGFFLRFRMGEGEGPSPLGRLNVNLQPAFRSTDDRPLFVLTLVARGQPRGKRLDDTITFFNLGHDWIVRAFSSITTPEMHLTWRRTHGR